VWNSVRVGGGGGGRWGGAFFGIHLLSLFFFFFLFFFSLARSLSFSLLCVPFLFIPPLLDSSHPRNNSVSPLCLVVCVVCCGVCVCVHRTSHILHTAAAVSKKTNKKNTPLSLTHSHSLSLTLTQTLILSSSFRNTASQPVLLRVPLTESDRTHTIYRSNHQSAPPPLLLLPPPPLSSLSY